MNKLVVCNLKMNLSKQDVDQYLKKLDAKNLDNVIFCPSAIYIPYFLNNNLKVGIQNISRYENGSHTGQVSALQVSSLGIKYSIVGHSETKNDLTEINDKLKLCSKYNIVPIVCVGEETKMPISNTLDVLSNMIDNILKNVNLEHLIIAYEPSWIIGKNALVDTNALHEITNFLKKYLEKFDINDIMILYGGSVNENDYKDIISLPSVDGVLIGQASTKIEELLKIIEVTC